jgi:O-antigen ligase
MSGDPAIRIAGVVRFANPVRGRVREAYLWSLASVFVASATPAVSVAGLRAVPALLFAMAVCLLWALLLALGRPSPRIPVSFLVALAAGFALLSLTVAVGAVPVESGLTKTIGWAAQLSVVLLVIFVRPRDLSPLLVRIGVATLVWGSFLGALAMAQAFGMVGGANHVRQTLGPLQFQRAQLVFDQPNPLAVWFVVALPLTFAVPPGGRLRTLGVGAARVLVLLGLFAAFSRAAFAALAMAVVASAVLTATRGGVLWAARVTAWAALAIAVVVSLVPAATSVARDAAASVLGGGFSLFERIELMFVGQRMWFERPLLGFGPGGFEVFGSSYGYATAGTLRMPHNVFLHAASETGLFGLLLVVVYFAVMVVFTRSAPRSLTTSFWAASTALALGWPLTHGLGEIYIALAALVVLHARAARAQAPASVRAEGAA